MEPGDPTKPKRDKNIGAVIFALLLICGFWTINTAMRLDLIPAVHTKHLEIPLLCATGAAFLLVLWAAGILDRR